MRVSKRDGSVAGNSSDGSTARRVRRFGASMGGARIGKTARTSRALGIAAAAVGLSAAFPALSQGAIRIDNALATTGPDPSTANAGNPSTTDSLTYTVSPGASVLVVQFGMAADNNTNGAPSTQTPVIKWNAPTAQTLTGFQEVSSASTQIYADV